MFSLKKLSPILVFSMLIYINISTTSEQIYPTVLLKNVQTKRSKNKEEKEEKNIVIRIFKLRLNKPNRLRLNRSDRHHLKEPKRLCV